MFSGDGLRQLKPPPPPPFHEGASAEARGSEQIESVPVNHDLSYDPDLITHWEPFDGSCQHPIRETAPPMNTDEVFCTGHIDTNQLIQLESCKPTPKHPISIPSRASHIVTPLLPHHCMGRPLMPAPRPGPSLLCRLRPVKWLPHWVPVQQQ